MRSLTEIADCSTVATIGSHPNRGKENRKHAVENDDEEDRLHHGSRGLQAKRFGASLHTQTFAASDDPDDERHEWRLDHADLEVGYRDGFSDAGNENLRAHAAIKPRHQSAAVKR